MNRSHLVGVLGTAVALVWVCPQAHALDAQAISRIAKSVTVRIVGQTEGSGVLIKQKDDTYTVLTAAHVVASADTYEVITPDGKRIRAAAIKKLPDIDVALVQFKSGPFYPVVDLGDSTQASEGALSYVAGFPLQTEAISKTIYNFTEGKITANAGQALKDGYSLVYSNSTLPGMSGGPVLNRQGQLIGIHGRADTTAEVQDQNLNPDIYIKSGFNLGIPTRRFVRLAHQIGINLGFPDAAAQSSITTKADDFFLKAQGQIDKQDYPGAVKTLDQALRAKSDYAAAYALRGYAHVRQGQGRLAAGDTKRAIRLDPKNARAYLVRSLVQSRVGRAQEALANINRSIRLQPNEPEAYAIRGFVQMLQDDYAETIEDMNKAAQLWRAQGNVAQAENIESAIPSFTALTLGQGTSEHYIARAAMRIQFADPRGAVLDFQAAASVALQQKQLAQYLVAKSALRSKFPKAARRYAVQDNPQDVFVGHPRILRRLNQRIQSQPNDAAAYRRRGTFLMEILNRPQQARSDIQKAVAYYRQQKDQTNEQLMTSYLEALKSNVR